MVPRQHEDPALFREAVNYTAAMTGFSSRLVEKDYFLTLVLAYQSLVSLDAQTLGLVESLALRVALR